MKSRGVWGVVLALAVCGALVLPSVAAAGSISGTVTAVGGGGLGGIDVCATPEPYTFEVPCVETNGGGSYQLPFLRESAYRLRFSSARNNLNYVDQFYDGKLTYPGDTLTVGANEDKTVDAVLQPGGTIAGAVTDANTHAPIAGLQVCATPTPDTAGIDRCWRTDAGGNYAINGLSPADYRVAFFGEGAFNYLSQYYDGVEGAGSATLIPIVANQVATGVDAAMQPGVEISGRLTEAGSGKPLTGVSVSLLWAATGEEARTVETDAAGSYAFRGRPAGSYVVAFSHTVGGPWNNDCYSEQFYNSSATLAGATPLAVAPPQMVSGIDGQVSDLCPRPPLEPVRVDLIPFVPTNPPPLKCGKGKKKKWVKGKQRCVKKHKRKHHHKRGGHGPHAVATER